MSGKIREREIQNELANIKWKVEAAGTQIEFPEKWKPLSGKLDFAAATSFELFMAKSFQIDRKTLLLQGDIFPTAAGWEKRRENRCQVNGSQQCELNWAGLTGWCPLYQKFFAPQALLSFFSHTFSLGSRQCIFANGSRQESHLGDIH